jgi:hypothetical protein
MTYAEHRQNERKHRKQRFAALSAEQQRVEWEKRMRWLWRHFLDLPSWHVNITAGCPVCQQGVRLRAHSWPAYFSCVCGTNVVLDRWLPDDIERVATMSPRALARFAETHPGSVDQFGYPPAERLRDLKDGEFE